MDLHEDAENNTVTAIFDLPGLSKEAVHIDVQNNRLTVSGENQSSSEKMEKGYTVRERGYGRFSRSLPLPSGTKVRSLQRCRDEGCWADSDFR
jgi:HSP20 family protein